MTPAAATWNLAEYSTNPAPLTPAELTIEQQWVALHTDIVVAKDLGTFDERRAEFAARVATLRAAEVQG